MSADALFETTRTRLLKRYAEEKRDFNAGTKPYKSTQQVIFDIVDPQPSSGSTIAYAVARKSQRLEFFGYGSGESIPYGPATRIATEADTNLSKGRRTNGVEDFVIEAISFTHKSTRVANPPSVAAGQTPADIDALAAFRGEAVIYDPASIACPIQCFSPFNGEDVFFEALKPQMSVEFEWDRRRVEKVGTADAIPEGGAKSLLRASGEPINGNRYKIPEGYLWRRQGEPDSEFVARVVLVEAVVIPISLSALGGQTSTLTKPDKIYVDLSMRLHGLSLNVPSAN